MIARIRLVLANIKRKKELERKCALYNEMTDILVTLRGEQLNNGEQIWNKLHQDYFHRKWIETQLAIDKIKIFD